MKKNKQTKNMNFLSPAQQRCKDLVFDRHGEAETRGNESEQQIRNLSLARSSRPKLKSGGNGNSEHPANKLQESIGGSHEEVQESI